MSDIHSPARSAVSKQKRLDRSCVLCHQRKIRCDKKSPCGNCQRADVLCYYPEPEQIVRRPQKTTIADVSARLARLERTISALSKDSPIKQDSASPEPPAFDFNTIESEPVVAESPHSNEKLIQANGSSRYFNEGLLSRIIEEEQEIHSLIGLQIDALNLKEQSAIVEIEPLLSSFHRPILANESYHPSRRCAVQLWQTYINSVDPLIKILHIPTTQRIVYAAINSSVSIDSNTDSLLLAIYFAATASLSNHNAINLLGQERSVALNNFKRGLEQSLAASNFLNAPTFTSLQAITIYTRCLRVCSGGRALWAFNGLILRSAQSIGLHRDGKNFKLSPFECEMRRRLWWYIVANDSRVAEDHGFTVFNFDAAADTALPLNINDSQLDPGMNELPTVEPQWSDMTFTLIVIEANNALLGLYHTALRSNQNPVSEQTRKETFSTLRAHFEQDYLRHCDQNIPVQRATWLIGQVLSRKLDFKSRLPWPKPSFAVSSPPSAFSKSDLPSQATEETLLEACKILELNEGFSSDDMLEGYQWIFKTYPQYDVLMYVLWHLCIKPVGPNVDKAWTLVDACFAMETAHKEGWKWTVLKRLREKAVKVRLPAKARNDEGLMGKVADEQSLGMNLGDDVAMGAGLDGSLAPGANWMPDQLDLDWSTLVENVDMQNYEF